MSEAVFPQSRSVSFIQSIRVLAVRAYMLCKTFYIELNGQVECMVMLKIWQTSVLD